MGRSPNRKRPPRPWQNDPETLKGVCSDFGRSPYRDSWRIRSSLPGPRHNSGEHFYCTCNNRSGTTDIIAANQLLFFYAERTSRVASSSALKTYIFGACFSSVCNAYENHFALSWLPSCPKEKAQRTASSIPTCVRAFLPGKTTSVGFHRAFPYQIRHIGISCRHVHSSIQPQRELISYSKTTP